MIPSPLWICCWWDVFFGGLLGIGMSTTLLVLCWQDGGADAAAAASGSDGDQAASAAELWIKFEA